jgi:hypothetical protein
MKRRKPNNRDKTSHKTKGKLKKTWKKRSIIKVNQAKIYEMRESGLNNKSILIRVATPFPGDNPAFHSIHAHPQRLGD